MIDDPSDKWSPGEYFGLVRDSGQTRSSRFPTSDRIALPLRVAAEADGFDSYSFRPKQTLERECPSPVTPYQRENPKPQSPSNPRHN
ncbi:hypothetical protein L2E82_31938 [Cichorium intybus]|uniref:Uncharacterized protein n=1 Tax=Cichorium intybus TaxID=13427 RepID=A0ACB9BG83_CICIN|nr:hypothetical protein L2E82_31938 [Cichorium intybus]